MKFIIELDEIPNTGLFKARGANTLVFDQRGIENILKSYEEEHEIDWYKVAVDTPVLVRDFENEVWQRRYFAKYENGLVYTWMYGYTSWTILDGHTETWPYAKLAETEKGEE